jgi:hypothetical protein
VFARCGALAKVGNFYLNLTVCGAEQGPVIEVLRMLDLRAFVAPSQRRLTVVYPELSDVWNDPDSASDVAGTLSVHLDCPVLIAAVFDDDVLFLSLFEGLDQTFEYNSTDRRLKNLRRLYEASGRNGRQSVLWLILKLPHPFPYLFEVHRHLHILKALRMPIWAAGTGYTYLRKNGEIPPGLTAGDLIET